MGVMVSAQIRANASGGRARLQGERGMTDPAELLAMLSIHGINLQHVPGGVPSLVALDVAGGLGMMHDHAAAAMLHGKYSGDMYSLASFFDHWQKVVDRQAYVEKWGNDERARLLANYSFGEWYDDQKCKTCKGRSTHPNADGVVGPCPVCDGTGNRRIGHRAPARALGMSAESYRKSAWPRRMEWARGELQRRELAASAKLGWVMRRV